MSLKLYEESDIQNIADAIRGKNGLSDTYKVSQMASAVTAIPTGSGGEYDIIATVDGDFQDLNITDYNYTPTTVTPTASATATSGVTYTHILSKLTFVEIERYAKAISNASDIDNTTTDVYIDDGNNHYVLSVGDTICYTLSNDEFMIDQIIGFNHDDLTNATAYGETTATGKAGITFQMENCLATRYPMNDTNTNAGGWGDSVMRTTTLPAIKLTLPADLQSVIKYVNKKAANGGSTNYTETETLSDDLFLLAEIEIFGSVNQSQDGANEGIQYVYWTINNTANDRIKHYYQDEASAFNYWWGRSSRNINITNFCDCTASGATGSLSATTSRGISFAYCI